MDTWKTSLSDEARMKEFFECETPCKYKIKVSLLGFKPALWMLDRYYAYSLVCRSRILSWLFSSDTFETLWMTLLILGIGAFEFYYLGIKEIWPSIYAIGVAMLYFAVYAAYIAVYKWLHETDLRLRIFAGRNTLVYESAI